MEKAEIYEEFGRRLAALRKERGLSQQALAEELPVTRQAVSNWERGQTTPDLGSLQRLCQVLDVDWNHLCGGPASPVPQRRWPVRHTAVLLAAGIALAIVAGILALRQSAPGPQASAYAGFHGEVLRSHLTAVTEPGPYGLRKTAARELADRLAALTATGPVSLTPKLREGFDLAGEACAFRFLPAYEDGVFPDGWDAVLTWCWYGLSQKGLPATEQVDQWLTAWFGALPQAHQSTEHFELKEGVYYPDTSCSGTCTYALEALERLEDGSFRARLRLTEISGVGKKLPARFLNLALTAQDGQICFSSVSWEDSAA